MDISVRNLIRQALIDGNIVAQGQPLPPSLAEDALFNLNLILEQFNLQDTLVQNTLMITHTLVVNQVSYSIGQSAANINIARPLSIKSAYTRDSNGYDTEVAIISYSEYETLEDKATTSSELEKLAYQNTLPNGTIYLYPVPSTVKTLRLELYAKFPVVTLDDILSFTDGYTEVTLNLLSQKLCLQMGRQALIPQLQASAAKTQTMVQAKNAKHIKKSMVIDPMLTIHPGGMYNPYSDQ